MPTAAERPTALDTSVAVPLLVQTHLAHRLVSERLRGRSLALSGHALVETYAVLTRLPGDVRVAPPDAARLLSERFERPLLLSLEDSAELPANLATLGIAGGATYDAIVGLAAERSGCVLATRDGRAHATYQAVGVTVEFIA